MNTKPTLKKPYSYYTSNDLPSDCKNIMSDQKFQEKVTIYMKFWSARDCDANPSILYIFGDNDKQKGAGGQAVIRYKENSTGIPTKKYPSNDKSSFYTDEELQENCRKIFNSIIKLIRRSVKYDTILFPVDGFGTGLANLQVVAPLTMKFMEDLINDCFGIGYEKYRTNGGIEVVLNETS